MRPKDLCGETSLPQDETHWTTHTSTPPVPPATDSCCTVLYNRQLGYLPDGSHTPRSSARQRLLYHVGTIKLGSFATACEEEKVGRGDISDPRRCGGLRFDRWVFGAYFVLNSLNRVRNDPYLTLSLSLTHLLPRGGLLGRVS